MTTMTDDERELVRQQSFDCDGPIDIDIELSCGSIEVRFAEEEAAAVVPPEQDAEPDARQPEHDAGSPEQDAGSPEQNGGIPGQDAGSSGQDAGRDGQDAGSATGPYAGPADQDAGWNGQAVVIEVRHEPRAGANWGLAGLLNWFSGQFGEMASDIAADAVHETEIVMEGNRLTVRGPRSMPLRTVPLSIVVHAPAGSSLSTRAGSARTNVGGPAGRVRVDTGSGDVWVDRATGQVQVKSGSGNVRLGPMPELSARTGSGDLEVTSISAGGSVHSGSGDIWIGTVSCVGGLDDRVTVRTGSGDLTVADAARGQLQLVTGSGDLRLGIRSGVLAELDVVSGSGRVRSDLPVSNEPPAGGEPVLSVRARIGSGDAVIGPATA